MRHCVLERIFVSSRNRIAEKLPRKGIATPGDVDGVVWVQSRYNVVLLLIEGTPRKEIERGKARENQ